MEDERRSRVFTVELVLGALAALALVATLALPKLIQARRHGNEASAIGALKTISTRQSVFREGDFEQDGNLDYGMLSELARIGAVDEALGSGTKQGYLFQASYGFATSEFLWFGVANPADEWAGDRSFETNQAGVIFYTSAGPLQIDTNTCLLPRGTWARYGSK